MTRPIGYYVHHHGEGHRRRALALAPHMAGRLVLLGTGLEERTEGVASVPLPDDRLTDGFDGVDETTRPQALHYAPIDHAGIRRRVATVAGWIAEAQPALMIVDVSVEIAMLARLASVPTVYVRLAGRRDDAAPLEAFRGATALLAPFAAALDDPALPEWIAASTIHAPGLGPRVPGAMIDEALVLGVAGRGGTAVTGEHWAAAAYATPDRRWRVIGNCRPPADAPANLSFAGWVSDAAREIAAAGIVVAAAGDGTLAAVIAARRPLLCIPENRPFDEQRIKATRLAATGAAIVRDSWPRTDEWPALLAEAERLDPAALAALDDAEGAARTGAQLLAIADAVTA